VSTLTSSVGAPMDDKIDAMVRVLRESKSKIKELEDLYDEAQAALKDGFTFPVTMSSCSPRPWG
jgi:hypothetical protein